MLFRGDLEEALAVLIFSQFQFSVTFWYNDSPVLNSNLYVAAFYYP